MNMDVAYNFTQLKNNSWTVFNDRDIQEFLTKWYLKDGLQMSHWAFNEACHPHTYKQLIQQLIAQPVVAQQIPWNADDVTINLVPASVTSLEFFDRLLDPANGVVRRGSDGEIRGCIEETIDSFLVSDELRQMLLNEESETYPLYSQNERKELLFRLFQHLVLGGQWCQYEDNVKPYVQASTALYKDLLRVQKNQDSGEVEIRSRCFFLAPTTAAFNMQDFAYFAVDPGLREIYILSHKY